GPVRGVREWLALLRRHLSRVILYEALAISFGVLATLPLLAPVWLAGGAALGDGATVSVKDAVLCVLGGLALSPLLAYLIVANVYIYLNLRYETAPGLK